MGVVIIDGSTVRDFVNDTDKFNESVDRQFRSLDANADGVLSRAELRKAVQSMRLIETQFGFDDAAAAATPEELLRLYDAIFDGFDCDGSGSVDPAEFRAEMRKILLAIADGLGSCPIQMALEDDDPSLLKHAADLEAAKAAKSAAGSA